MVMATALGLCSSPFPQRRKESIKLLEPEMVVCSVTLPPATYTHVKRLCKALYFFNKSPFLPDSIMNEKGPDRVILQRNVSALSKHTVAPRH